jgi:hypothetical protein
MLSPDLANSSFSLDFNINELTFIPLSFDVGIFISDLSLHYPATGSKCHFHVNNTLDRFLPSQSIMTSTSLFDSSSPVRTPFDPQFFRMLIPNTTFSPIPLDDTDFLFLDTSPHIILDPFILDSSENFSSHENDSFSKWTHFVGQLVPSSLSIEPHRRNSGGIATLQFSSVETETSFPRRKLVFVDVEVQVLISVGNDDSPLVSSSLPGNALSPLVEKINQFAPIGTIPLNPWITLEPNFALVDVVLLEMIGNPFAFIYSREEDPLSDTDENDFGLNDFGFDPIYFVDYSWAES